MYVPQSASGGLSSALGIRIRPDFALYAGRLLSAGCGDREGRDAGVYAKWSVNPKSSKWLQTSIDVFWHKL